MLDVQGGAHKKRVRRSSLLNAKKLYEDAQMARKVKQYLSNLTVETDEERHQIMSLQCEPSYSTCESDRKSAERISFSTSLCKKLSVLYQWCSCAAPFSVIGFAPPPSGLLDVFYVFGR